MSLFVQETLLDRVVALVERVFGKRGTGGGQEATAAAGIIPRIQVAFFSRQGGPVTVEGHGYWDARDHVSTRRKKGEWTGYHAEMMIVSAMVSMFSQDARNLSVSQAKYLLSQAGAPAIAANADCCAHCAKMLDKLGIARPSGSDKTSLTGWWNPFTDEVYPNGSSEFTNFLND
jgi:hypothetical protein